MSLLDPHFKYTPALHTDVSQTLKRFGFKPTTEEEREARQKRLHDEPNVTPLKRKVKQQ